MGPLTILLIGHAAQHKRAVLHSVCAVQPRMLSLDMADPTQASPPGIVRPRMDLQLSEIGVQGGRTAYLVDVPDCQGGGARVMGRWAGSLLGALLLLDCSEAAPQCMQQLTLAINEYRPLAHASAMVVGAVAHDAAARTRVHLCQAALREAGLRVPFLTVEPTKRQESMLLIDALIVNAEVDIALKREPP